MRELLGEKDNRRLHLIEKIYLRPGISMDTLADELHYSTIQVQVDIAFLNEILDPILITTTKDKMCYVEIPQHLSTRHIYKEIISRNVHCKVLESLLFEEFETYEQLADKVYVSVATLKRVIAFMNECFEKDDITIKTRPLRIVGNEYNIRALYMFYLHERYPDDVYPVEERISFFSKELSDFFVNHNEHQKFHYSSITRLNRYVCVSLLREIKGHSYPYIYKDFEMPKHEEILNKYKNRVLFEQVFKISFDSDFYFSVFNHYLDPLRLSNFGELNKLYKQHTSARKIIDSVRKALEILGGTYRLPIENQEYLLQKLYNLMLVGSKISITPYIIYPNRKIFLLFNKVLPKDMIENIRAIYAENFKEIHQKNPSYFYEFLYILVTHWEGFYDTLSKQNVPCKVGLFFNTDYHHMKYVKADLEFHFHNKVNLEVIETLTLRDLEKISRTYDVIVANFILPENIELQCELVSITDALWDDKKLQLQNIINRIYYKN